MSCLNTELNFFLFNLSFLRKGLDDVLINLLLPVFWYILIHVKTITLLYVIKKIKIHDNMFSCQTKPLPSRKQLSHCNTFSLNLILSDINIAMSTVFTFLIYTKFNLYGCLVFKIKDLYET